MDNRNYESGASATPPTAPASPSAGYPTKGNPGSGTPATKPGEFWFHKIGEELRALIVAAGLTPSDSNLHQVLDAVQALFIGLSNFTGSNQSLGSSGYQNLPGGLILQWGANTVSANSTLTVTLPITYPTAEYLTLAAPQDSGTSTNYRVSAYAISTSQIGLANANIGPIPTRWISLGK